MNSLCTCPVCGDSLQGALSATLLVQDAVLCGSCGFTEPLTRRVARVDGDYSAKADVPIAHLIYPN